VGVSGRLGNVKGSPVTSLLGWSDHQAQSRGRPARGRPGTDLHPL